mgnify:CR=1 FL=1
MPAPRRVTRRQHRKAGLTLNPGRGEREMEVAVAAMGFVYERQKTIGPWFADFAIPELRLVIEVDGASHDPVADARRDAGMAQTDWTVVRVSAEDAKADAVGALFAALPDIYRFSALRNTNRARLCALIRGE